MMLPPTAQLAAAALTALTALSNHVSALNFTILNGQIFTPGPAVLDAPQPGTPLGGELLEVALDVSANGKLQLPPYPQDTPSRIHNITIFLQSHITGRNFTITNGTKIDALPALPGDIMLSEPGSTVKHVKWTWPDCLIGNGPPREGEQSVRGLYNISIRQNFHLNNKPYYTIFNVPISVTNSIQKLGGGASNGDNSQGTGRPSCDFLNNPLLSPEEADAEVAASLREVSGAVMFAPGDATTVQQTFGPPGMGTGASLRSDLWCVGGMLLTTMFTLGM